MKILKLFGFFLLVIFIYGIKTETNNEVEVKTITNNRTGEIIFHKIIKRQERESEEKDPDNKNDKKNVKDPNKDNKNDGKNLNKKDPKSDSNEEDNTNKIKDPKGTKKDPEESKDTSKEKQKDKKNKYKKRITAKKNLKKQKARASRDKQKNDNSDDERPLVTNYERSPVSGNERQTVTSYERPNIESFKDDNGKVDYRCKRQNNSCNKDSKNIASKRNKVKTKKTIEKKGTNQQTKSSKPNSRPKLKHGDYDKLEILHGPTVESERFRVRNYNAKNKNSEQSTSLNHIVPWSVLTEDDQRINILKNILAGNAKMNGKIGANLDPHVVQDPKEKGKFKLSDNTRLSIEKYNPVGPDKAKFLVKEIDGKEHLITSHSIEIGKTDKGEPKYSFSIPINSLNKKDQEFVKKTIGTKEVTFDII